MERNSEQTEFKRTLGGGGKQGCRQSQLHREGIVSSSAQNKEISLPASSSAILGSLIFIRGIGNSLNPFFIIFILSIN